MDQGYTVIRFWNHEIWQDRDAVLRQIDQALTTLPAVFARQRPRALPPSDPHRAGGDGDQRRLADAASPASGRGDSDES